MDTTDRPQPHYTMIEAFRRGAPSHVDHARQNEAALWRHRDHLLFEVVASVSGRREGPPSRSRRSHAPWVHSVDHYLRLHAHRRSPVLCDSGPESCNGFVGPAEIEQ